MQVTALRPEIEAPPDTLALSYAVTRARLVVGAAWLDHHLVFANSIGAPVDPSNLSRAFARLTERAGLGAWHPNELRHLACSLLSAAGIPSNTWPTSSATTAPPASAG